MTPSINALRERAEEFGRIVVARAYADWQDGYHQGDATDLYASGIEPIYVPTLRMGLRQKNSVDVKLSTDCVEFCHRLTAIGTYVLVTGDQDFLHVVNALRPHGKQVIIIAVSWATSARLAERVDRVLYYDRDIVPAPSDERTPEPSVSIESAAGSDGVTMASAVAVPAEHLMQDLRLENDQLADLHKILEEILRIVREYRSNGRPLLLSQLGLELTRSVSTQSFVMIAKGRLKQLATTLESHGLLQVQELGLVDWLYLPDEAVPTAERAEDLDQSYLGDPTSTDQYTTLPRTERLEVIDAIRDLRAQPGISYLTFNRICEEVSRTSVGRRRGWNVRRFVSGMVDANVLSPDKDQTWFDPTTGNVGMFRSLRLNLAHPHVADLLVSA